MIVVAILIAVAVVCVPILQNPRSGALQLLVVMVDVPGRGNQRIYAVIHGNDVGINVPITVHGAQHSGSSSSDHTCRPVQVVDPADERLLCGRGDNSRTENANWETFRVPTHHILGQSLCVGVRVGPGTDQSGKLKETDF